MKILHVMAGAEFGGAEGACVDMAIAMKEAGAEIMVATRPNAIRVPELQDASIDVAEMRFGSKIDVFTKWKLRKTIKAFQPDIVQCWMSRGPSFVPQWDEDMGIAPYVTVARLGGYYKIKYFKSMDYFVGCTPDIVRYLQDNGVQEDKVTHINNHAQIESFDTPVSRKSFDTPDDAPLVFAIGRLHEVKGFDTLIEVIAEMEGVHLWIAGEGPERENFETLIADLGCGDRVKLLGWRTDRAALYDAADICVMPSRYEPFGAVFVQAWAQRIPLVITKSEGPRQFIRDGVDCLALDIDDKKAMKTAIQKLIDDPKLAQKLVENGFDHFQKSFTKDQCVAEYFDYYRRIMNQASDIKP